MSQNNFKLKPVFFNLQVRKSLTWIILRHLKLIVSIFLQLYILNLLLRAVGKSIVWANRY